MRVGILGTGVVGRSLGSGFVEIGHEVKLGSRDGTNEEARSWAAGHRGRASTGTFQEAARFGEVVVVAVLGRAVEAALQRADPRSFAGKVTIDTTNPLEFHPESPPTLFVGHNDSLGERVQRWLPEARVVKAFNVVGNAHFFRPTFADGPPDMFICGNDAGAKATVTGILRDFGWPSIDIGGIDGARALEEVCVLWVRAGIQLGNWNIALKMLRK